MLVFRSLLSFASEDREPFGIPVVCAHRRFGLAYSPNLMVLKLLFKFVNFRTRENVLHTSSTGHRKFHRRYVAAGFCGRLLQFCISAVSMMKEHVGHFLDRSSDRRQKDVNLNEVFNKLDDLSPLGNTPKDQRYKGAFNIFESIAENNPLAQGMYRVLTLSP